MSASLPPDFSNSFAALTPEAQQEVLNFMRRLPQRQPAEATKDQQRQALLELARGFSPEDIQAFKDAEAECEQIDPHAW